MRTPLEWAEYCKKNIKGGYIAGGDRSRLYELGQELVASLRRFNLWKPGDTILDLGCGNGRLPIGLLSEPVSYYGLDVVASSITFCRRAFADYPHFTFSHLDVKNTRYNPRGEIAPLRVKLPYPVDFADCIIASSLFTHLGPIRVSRHYLSESARVLKPGGMLYCTWFASPPNKPTNSTKKTVYPRRSIVRLLRPHFRILNQRGGKTTRKRDQWLIIAQRRA